MSYKVYIFYDIMSVGNEHVVFKTNTQEKQK